MPAVPLDASTGLGAVVVELGVFTVVQLGFVDPVKVAKDKTDTTSRHFTDAPPFDDIVVVSQRNAAERLAAAATLLISTVELRATAPTAFFRNENFLSDTRVMCIGSRHSLSSGLLILMPNYKVIEKATIADNG